MSARATALGATPSRAPRLDTIAVIDSPEHVRFEYRLAGPARRGLAYAIDLAMKVAVIFIAVFLMTLGGMDTAASGWSLGLLALVAFVLEWGYNVGFETLANGRTPGKRAMKMRVIKEGGHPINVMDSLLRNLLRAADFLPSGYALGMLVMGLDPRFRRLGDLVAGTIVVVEIGSHAGGPIVLRPPATPDELAAIPGTARLLPAEREALDLFVRRLGRLSPARADELAALVLPRFADRIAAGASTSPARSLALLYLRATERRSA